MTADEIIDELRALSDPAKIADCASCAAQLCANVFERKRQDNLH